MIPVLLSGGTGSRLWPLSRATYPKQFQPDVLCHAKLAYDNATADYDFTRLNAESFAKCPSISIDYAVMEHTREGRVVPLDAGWSDIGS